MPDLDPIKVKVEVTYDGSGIEEAKKDLSSLSDIGGNLGGDLSNAGDGLAALDEQARKTSEGTKSLNSALEGLPKVFEGGTEAVSGFNETLGENKQAFDDLQQTVEDTGTAVGTVSDTLQKAAPPMQVLSERTQGLNENLSQVQQTLSGSSDAWAQFTNTMQADSGTRIADSINKEFVGLPPTSFVEGVNQAAENARAFQSALTSPDSFQVIDDHLAKTGQFYEDFANSLGTSDQELLHQMSNDWVQTNSFTDEAGKSFANLGKNAQTGFSTVASSAGDANRAVADFMGKSSDAVKMMEPIGFGEAFSGASEGLMGMLNNVAMPLMAVQMIGMAVQAVGQSMYDSAAIAEGPAAHSFGTFTGTVDALGQSIQRTGAQFSENFGQGVLPTLNQLNYQMSQGGGLDLTGSPLGMGASALFSLAEIGTGFNPIGGFEGLMNLGAKIIGVQQPYQGPGPEQQAQVTYEQQLGQMPQTVRNLTYQSRAQSDQLLQMASDPGYLQSQDEYQAAQVAYQQAQQRYDSQHYISPRQALMDYQAKQYDVQQMQLYQQATSGGPDFSMGGIGATLGATYGPIGNDLSYLPLFGIPRAAFGGGGPYSGAIGGISDFFGGASIGNILSAPFNPLAAISTAGAGLNNLFGGNLFGGIGNILSGLFGGGGGGGADFIGGGCFVAGTRVLMADGTSKPIETLQIGEQVLAHDGEKQIHATITDRITFPAKQTYKLIFSDGTTLFTTDSHPIATTQGWKSVSPESTKLENPGLPVTTLEVGDSIYTADSTTCRLVSMQEHEIAPVFNITVNAAHTYYANNILVHNAKASFGPSVNTQENAGGGPGGQFQWPPMPEIKWPSLPEIKWPSLPEIKWPSLPEIKWPSLPDIKWPSLPEIKWPSLPEIKWPSLPEIKWPSLPEIHWPALPQISWPSLPQISWPSLPQITWPALPQISWPSLPQINWPALPSFSWPSIPAFSWPSLPEIKWPSLPDFHWPSMPDFQWPSMPQFSWPPMPQLSLSLPVGLPFFASGVENFGGGYAMVGEQGPELVALPAGSSVYPMTGGASVGGGVSPISLGGVGGGSGGGSAPQSINVVVQVDSQAIISAIGLPLSQNIRLASGMRGF